MKTRIFHLHALSALHVGVGQAVGVVDLPIARAKATNLPLVPGSALKGVLRDEFDNKEGQTILFGPAKIDKNDDAFAGALALGDAHLLLLPVRALAGVMALVTCPFVLRRYREDLGRTGVAALPDVPEVAGEAALLGANPVNMVAGKVILEDLDLAASPSDLAGSWAELIAARVHPGDTAWQTQLKQRLVVVSDEVFSFLADTATEIRARISIDNSRRVVKEGPWYEENLPAETVLWGLLAIGPGREIKGSVALDADAAAGKWDAGITGLPVIQIGGKATVGRGLVRFLG